MIIRTIVIQQINKSDWLKYYWKTSRPIIFNNGLKEKADNKTDKITTIKHLTKPRYFNPK